MTGQILAGNTATDAVRYQILIMFMISSGTGFGVILSLWLMRRRMFDTRDRLRMRDSFHAAEDCSKWLVWRIDKAGFVQF